MDWETAPDITKEIKVLAKTLQLDYLNPERIFCFRSHGSSSRARARIWSLSRIWQQALNITPAYCIEVLSERFDKLSHEEQRRTLVHELLHIPKNFSGSLVPHRQLGGQSFHKRADILFRQVLNQEKAK